jgi:hypothetical protein
VATWLKGDTPLDVYIAEPANAKPTAAVRPMPARPAVPAPLVKSHHPAAARRRQSQTDPRAGLTVRCTADFPPLSNTQVVIFTDIYGFEFSNTRLWADRLAKKGGFLVVIPDFFRGDALTDATRNTSAVCEPFAQAGQARASLQHSLKPRLASPACSAPASPPVHGGPWSAPTPHYTRLSS